jgi:hypothetical protein
MMPNLLAFPVAFLGIIRAGGVQVNVNPLYTPRELEHQLAPLNRGSLNSARIRGTLVPVEEPSTASKADMPAVCPMSFSSLQCPRCR